MYINSYADKRYLLSYGICSGYGLAAAAEQESARKSTKDRATRNESVHAGPSLGGKLVGGGLEPSTSWM
jgi:hypothetical protein